MKHPSMRYSRLAAALMLGAAAGLTSLSAPAQVTDLSQTPLASASNLTVLPNVLFLLDDSGSMAFDGLPDNTEPQQGASERRYWHRVNNCKPRLPLTTGSNAGLLATHCDRIDPPVGAAEFNGLYYKPTYTYRPPLKADGTIMAKQTTWTAVPCDPFTSGWKCSDWYYVNPDYYDKGRADADEGTGNNQNYDNANIKQWYGTNTTFDVSTQWPEIVYCNSSSGDVNNLDQCRRNGLPRQTSEATGTPWSADARHTGNPFRYSMGRWGRGNGFAPSPATPGIVFSGAYPEAPAAHEFWRQSGSTEITIGLAHPLSGAGSTVRIIPRTGVTGTNALDYNGSGTCNAANSTCTATVTSDKLQLKYNTGKNTQQLVYSTFDLIVNMTRNGSVYTVDNAFAHGLAVGDLIDVSETVCTSGAGLCNFGGTNLVVTNVPDAKSFSYRALVTLSRSGTVVTVGNAVAHGLAVGAKINVTENSCSSSGCGFTVTNATVTQIVDTKTFRYTQGSGSKTGDGWYTYTVAGSNKVGEGYYIRNAASLYNYPKLKRGNPFYYTIEAVESCTDAALTNCAAGTANAYPAPVRFCTTAYDANRIDTPSGMDRLNAKPRCRKKYEDAAGYVFPRYGQFRRVDVSSAVSSYAGRPLRTDCAARPSCSYSEEMTNFANWFAYYRTRMLMMKTASGVAFGPIDSRYRVGFLTINPGSPVGTDRFLPINKFDPTQKQKWYDLFYKQDPGGSTPLPEALSRAGRYFAGKHDDINKGMDDDPMQYSCQQNFTILTTDGYWSALGGKKLDASAMDNQDSDSSKTPRPIWDGATDGVKPQDPDGTTNNYTAKGTLADVALYYYQTDLRANGSKGALGYDVGVDNVPTRQDPWGVSSSDKTPTKQHMITFGLGMAEGMMDWRSDYESAKDGDFLNVRKGSSNACSWVSGTCNWPVPGVNPKPPANLDDLWHAAINGRGRFFYARDTQAVQEGLYGALTSLQERSASGAAAATSTPNITPTDRGIFSTTYQTVEWYGDVIAQLIDPNNGRVLAGVSWSAKSKVEGLVGANSDSRLIYMYDDTAPSKVKTFTYANLSTTEKTWFDNKCTPSSNMSQCALLDPATDLPAAQDGTNLVNYLRGWSVYETTLYRDRKFALGDMVNAVPHYVAKPRYNFGDKVDWSGKTIDPPYLDWKELSTVKSRTKALYVGANDGMLHAFNADTGVEMWAFIPRQIAPGLWKIADESYATKHQYYVDGSPTSMDVWDGNNWRTVLVGGLNAGGRGFYALDVTVPGSPKALWEICSDSTLCPKSDPNMGYSFGNPIITKRAYDGKWVVLLTSGYNNVSPGDGQGWLFVVDVITGQILDKVTTGEGSTTAPSGLGKIAAWADNFYVDNTSPYVYGGDLEGNLWRFDLTKKDASVMHLGTAADDAKVPQPITTRPELGLVDDKYKVVFVGTGRYLGLQDLTDPATQTPKGTTSWQQSLYAFKDQDQDYKILRNSSNGLVQQTITELSGGLERTITRNAVDWSTDNGWYIDFNPGNKSPGERMNVDMQLALGTLQISTNVPDGSACSIGGDSWVYHIDYKLGSYIQGVTNNVVARKQPGVLTVGTVIYQLQKGSLVGQVQRVTDMVPDDIPVSPNSSPSKRTSWREMTPELHQ